MKKFISIILLAAAVCSCQQKFEKHWDLTVDSKAYTVSYSDTSLFITVWCSDPWTAELTEGSSWLTLQKTAGEGVSSLNMTFSKNSSLARRAILKISGGGNTTNITVMQKSAIGAPRLFFEDDSLSYCGSSWKVSVPVITNLPTKTLEEIVPVALDAWITDVRLDLSRPEPLDPEYGMPDCVRHFIEFTVNANSDQLRNSGVTLSVSDATGVVSKDTVAVRQSTEAPYLNLPETDEIGKEGGERSRAYTSNLGSMLDNVKVEVEYDDPSQYGFVYDVSFRLGALSYMVAPNNSGKARTARIRISIEDAIGQRTEGVVAISQSLKPASFENYEVRSVDELLTWRNSTDSWKSTDCIKLVADIDMTGRTWIPVDFTGTFDGQGHSIINLDIENEGYAGFIRILSGNGCVRNLTFGSATDKSCFCSVSADTKTKYAFVAPIVQVTGNAVVKNVTNYADVVLAETCTGGTGGNFIGGVVASYKSASVISSCTNNGDVKVLCVPGGYLDEGGVIGEATGSGDVKDCRNSGAVIYTSTAAVSTNIGGILGYFNTANALTGCTNSGSVTVNNTSGKSFKLYEGGVVGFVGNATVDKAKSPSLIESCSNSGAISFEGNKIGESFIGGVFGYTLNANVTVNTCSNSGAVSNTSSNTGNAYPYVGGFIGQSKGTDIFTSCVNTGNVTSSAATGSGGSLRFGGFCGAVGAAGAMFADCECRSVTVSNTVAPAGSNNGIGGFLGTCTGREASVSGTRVEDVTITGPTASKTWHGLLIGYTTQNVDATSCALKGSVNGIVVTEDMLNTGENIYNVYSGVKVDLTGSTIIK